MTNTELREKLEKLVEDGYHKSCPGGRCGECQYVHEQPCAFYVMTDHLIANGVTVNNCARPLEEWHEDYGDVLWWKFPIEEPPYVGSPLDTSWPDYHTHWTPITVPEPPKEE